MRFVSCVCFLILASTLMVAHSDDHHFIDPKADVSNQTTHLRRQAELLLKTYLAALMVVHREYFDEDERHLLPARAFEEVFREVDEFSGGRTRWIAVNTPAMNVDHEPQSAFEKDAAKSLAGGDDFFERIEGEFYRRAAPVPFLASCSKCHQSALGKRRSGRMAALVISLPIQPPPKQTTALRAAISP